MKAKKKCDINKLTRKQLIVKCRGRGIAIGRLEAKVRTLGARLTAAPSSVDVLNAFAEIEQLTQAYAKLQAEHIESVQAEVEADALTAQFRRETMEANTIVEEQREMVVDLKDRIFNLKKSWQDEHIRATKHDEHWRELAEFTALNTGSLINTLKIMHTASAHINDKYKEE